MKMQQAPQSSDAAGKATHVRWKILAILFIITTINYADRATISIAGPELKKLLGLSAVQMGFIFSAFAWSYVLAQLPGGWLLDRFGSKITYFFSIFLWSLFTMMVGAVGFFTGAAAVALLFGLRLLIGAPFPDLSRKPSKERGTHSGVFSCPAEAT